MLVWFAVDSLPSAWHQPVETCLDVWSGWSKVRDKALDVLIVSILGRVINLKQHRNNSGSFARVVLLLFRLSYLEQKKKKHHRRTQVFSSSGIPPSLGNRWLVLQFHFLRLNYNLVFAIDWDGSTIKPNGGWERPILNRRGQQIVNRVNTVSQSAGEAEMLLGQEWTEHSNAEERYNTAATSRGRHRDERA